MDMLTTPTVQLQQLPVRLAIRLGAPMRCVVVGNNSAGIRAADSNNNLSNKVEGIFILGEILA